MWKTAIRPRFCETDALGHINNTVIPVWFLEAREPLIALFCPDPLERAGALAVAHMEFTFHGETLFGSPVTVTTTTGEIRNRSFQVIQRCWQNGKLTAKGITTLVSFDARSRQSQWLTEQQKQQLEAHREGEQAEQVPREEIPAGTDETP